MSAEVLAEREDGTISRLVDAAPPIPVDVQARIATIARRPAPSISTKQAQG